MESAIACKRRGESGRSSTSKNRFPSRNFARSEAFHAGVEPLSARRALHNSTGPDPDTNSAPNSSVGSSERDAARRRASSARSRNLDLDPRATTMDNPNFTRKPEPKFSYHTVPRDVAVSRREILRKYSEEKEENPWKTIGSSGERWRRTEEGRGEGEVVEERPRTLPSTAKRWSKESWWKPVQSGRKISRQEILRRRASVDVPVATTSRGSGNIEEKVVESSEVKGGGRPPSSSYPKKNVPRPRNNGWGKEDERESKSVCDLLAVTSRLQDITRGLVPRPSTLPKIIHASRSARISAEDWATPRLAKDAVRREPPVYGRIRRRKSSLPSNAGTLRGSCTKEGGGARERAVDSVEFRTSTRHLRDPVPNTPYYSSPPASIGTRTSSPHGNAIYAKVYRKTSKGLQSQGGKADSKDSGDNRIEGEVGVDKGRTMSRRRIIESAKENGCKGSRDDSVEIQGESRSESQTLSRGKENAQGSKKESRETTSGEKRDSTRAEIDSGCKDSVAKCGTKPRTGLGENFRSTEREIGASRLATTLPGCVKNSRKCLAETRPGTDGKSSISTKRSKERSNYVKKTGAVSHVRAYSDANSGRSNSPVTTSSIFGFCTGKRKVHSTNSADKVECVSVCPTWNVKTVSMAKLWWKNITAC